MSESYYFEDWIEKAREVISPDVWHVCVRPVRQEYQILDHILHISKSLPTLKLGKC